MISALKLQLPMFLVMILIVVIGFYTLPGYTLNAKNAAMYNLVPN